MVGNTTGKIPAFGESLSKDSYFKAVRNCQTADGVIELFYQCLLSNGVRSVSYFHLPHVGCLDYEKNFFRFYPPIQNKVDTAQTDNYVRIVSDTLSKIRLLTYPTTAEQILKWSELTVDQKNALQQTTLPQFPNALIVPVHGAQYRNGIMIISYIETSHAHSDEEIRWAQWLSDAAHKRISVLMSNSSDLVRRLTDREREILKWVAKGKSNSVTADIVGISQHTVNGYLRSIYLKTGTSERTGAVLRCIGEGLLDL